MKQLMELEKVQDFLLIGMSLHGVPKDLAIGIIMFIDNDIKKMEELISFMQETERTPQQIISKAAVLL